MAVLTKIALWLFLALAVPSFSCVSASAIYPGDIQAGLLSIRQSELYNLSFNITSYGKYEQNITFRAVTAYLAPYISFDPQSLTLNSTNTAATFTVSIDANRISAGKHLLIIASDSNMPELEINSSYNQSIMGLVTPSSTAVITFQVPEKITSSATSGPGTIITGGSPLKKSLEIIIPPIIKTANESAVSTLTVKNTGEAILLNATLKISSDKPIVIDYGVYLGDIAPGERRTVFIRLSNISLEPAIVSINVSASNKYWTTSSTVNRIYAEIKPSAEIPVGEEGMWIPAIFQAENLGLTNATNMTIVPIVPEGWEKMDALISLLEPGKTLNRTIFIKAPNNSFGDYLIQVNAYEDNILLASKHLGISVTEGHNRSLIEIVDIPTEVNAPINSETKFNIFVDRFALPDGYRINLSLENAEGCIEGYQYSELFYPSMPGTSVFEVTIRTKNRPALCNMTVIVWSGDNYAYAKLMIFTTPQVLSPMVPIMAVVAFIAIFIILAIWRTKKKHEESPHEKVHGDNLQKGPKNPPK